VHSESIGHLPIRTLGEINHSREQDHADQAEEREHEEGGDGRLEHLGDSMKRVGRDKIEGGIAREG
jgi:hypothetical protein